MKTVSQPRHPSLKKDGPLSGKKDSLKTGKKVGMVEF